MKKINVIISTVICGILLSGFFELPVENTPTNNTQICTPVKVKAKGKSNANVNISHDVKKIKNGKRGYAHICLVLDASGSMSPYRDNMVESCKKFLKSQLDIKGEETLDIWTFSTLNINKIVNFEKLASKDYLKTYICDGGTPCFDAMLKAMEDLNNRIKTELIKPETVIFVFITDGRDNASKATLEDVSKELSTHLDHWNFLFLGAGQYAAQVGIDIGLPTQNCFDITLSSPSKIALMWKAIDKFSKRSRGVK